MVARLMRKQILELILTLLERKIRAQSSGTDIQARKTGFLQGILIVCRNRDVIGIGLKSKLVQSAVTDDPILGGDKTPNVVIIGIRCSQVRVRRRGYELRNSQLRVWSVRQLLRKP